MDFFFTFAVTLGLLLAMLPGVALCIAAVNLCEFWGLPSSYSLAVLFVSLALVTALYAHGLLWLASKAGA
jgi:hypothetical protein